MEFVERFADQGCLRVERLFDPALIAAVHDEFQRQFEGMGPDEFPPHLKVGGGDRRIQVPIELRGPLLDPMLTAHPLLVRIIETLLGPEPLIDSLVCVVALPGAVDQNLHQDHYQLFPDGVSQCLNPYAVTVAVPLIDLNPETGTTRLFPGSHRLGPDADGEWPPFGDGEPAYVERGGAYIMDYRLWHHGTANFSGLPRPVLYIVYSRPWFIDIRNFRHHARLRLAREDALAMPLHQRRLFLRLAAKGGFDLTEKELLAGG